MNKKHKITIPDPCHENWDEMTPNKNGRFCMSCSKTVVDFTSMLPEEVQHFFIQNQNNRICGRFRKSQLDTITIQIPSRVLYNQMNYSRMFLLALFIAMGTTLFSCQGKEGKKQKIDKIEVIEGNPSSSTMLGEPVAPNNDQIKEEAIDYNAIFPPAVLDVLPEQKMGIKKFYEFVNKNYIIPYKTEKFTRKIYLSFVIEKDGSLSAIKVLHDAGPGTAEEAIRVLKIAPKWIPGKINNQNVRTAYNLPITIKNEESLSSLKSEKVNSKKNTEEPVYNGGVAIETNAEFPGGIDRFYTFFEKEFKKPESSEAANIKIRLSFAVEKNGSTTYLQSEPAIDQPIEQEIIRILSLCPKWQPGEINGKKVRKLYSLPITLE